MRNNCRARYGHLHRQLDNICEAIPECVVEVER